MRWLLPVLVCGCNSIFSLDSTDLVDASNVTIDAPAPPHCPAIGTAPLYGNDLHQVPAVNCLSYTLSGGNVAMAMCNGMIARGPIDTELVEIPYDEYVDQPRLSPDGDHLFVSRYNQTTFHYDFEELAWTGDKLIPINVITPQGDDATMWGQYHALSTPTRGPDRHLMYTQYDGTTGDTELVELSDGSGAWQELSRYKPDELGLQPYAQMSQVSLSPDGLRLLIISYNGLATTSGGAGAGGGGGAQMYTSPVLYADRPSLDARFSPVQVLTTVPDLVQWPYMTEDCGRIYFSALNRVFYLTLQPSQSF